MNNAMASLSSGSINPANLEGGGGSGGGGGGSATGNNMSSSNQLMQDAMKNALKNPMTNPMAMKMNGVGKIIMDKNNKPHVTTAYGPLPLEVPKTDDDKKNESSTKKDKKVK